MFSSGRNVKEIELICRERSPLETITLVPLKKLPRMEDDSMNSGIFLFKNSKSKASNESIFQEKSFEPVNNAKNYVNYSPDFGEKWMKKFLKKMINPSLFFKPITPVPPTQLQTESQIIIPEATGNNDDGELIEVKSKGKKVTRGNRRHKTKSRRLRNKKLKLKLKLKLKNKSV